MDSEIMKKLRILADSAKFDVSCSSSGASRKNTGKIGSASVEGICHSWAADGRCISLLKILFTNKCVYDCQYCVNRRSADSEKACFEPRELANLTIEFYRRNYIEGLFLSSAVEKSPDYTAERILECLNILRFEYGFAGYIHAKIIPGVSKEILNAIGLVADRLSVNIELPTEESLKIFAPQKKPKAIFTPMTQITNTMIAQKTLKGPGTMFKGQSFSKIPYDGANSMFGDGNLQSVLAMTNQLEAAGASSHMVDAVAGSGFSFGGAGGFGLASAAASDGCDAGSLSSVGISGSAGLVREPRYKYKERFAPAGQTTQMIIGAGGESDAQILRTSESLYTTFKMKRVYFSAYIPVSNSPLLPSPLQAPPLAREHRLYQADWLLRFYGFKVKELFTAESQNLDTELDPKIIWALRNMDYFPMEVNKASLEELLRIPGIGTKSALRIIRQRRVAAVKYEDLKKMGVVLKRAKYFLTCSGRYYGGCELAPEYIRNKLLLGDGQEQLNMFGLLNSQLHTN